MCVSILSNKVDLSQVTSVLISTISVHWNSHTHHVSFPLVVKSVKTAKVNGLSWTSKQCHRGNNNKKRKFQHFRSFFYQSFSFFFVQQLVFSFPKVKCWVCVRLRLSSNGFSRLLLTGAARDESLSWLEPLPSLLFADLSSWPLFQEKLYRFLR